MKLDLVLQNFKLRTMQYTAAKDEICRVDLRCTAG